jgi:hypothetical protein
MGKATNAADKYVVDPAVDGVKSIWKDMMTTPTAVSSPVQGGTAGVTATPLAPLADTTIAAAPEAAATVAAPEAAATVAAPLSSAAAGGLSAGEGAMLASEAGSAASMAAGEGAMLAAEAGSAASMAAGAGAGGAAATSAAATAAETGLAMTPVGWGLAAAAILSNDDWRKKISDGMARLDPTQIGKGK